MGKIEQDVLKNIATFQEFELLEYIHGKAEKVRLKCKKCGHEFERYAHSFNSNPHMCPKCFPKGKSKSITIEEAQIRTDTIYYGQIQILEYKGNNSLTNWLCNNCGQIFSAVPVSIWRGRSKGCPFCTKQISVGEESIRQYLIKHNIQFIQQYRFKDCKDKLPLPFDFYLPKYNTCIEFQGEQHYLTRSLYHSDILIYHDNIKKDYCLQNNINLITIPFNELSNIEKYLKLIPERNNETL